MELVGKGLYLAALLYSALEDSFRPSLPVSCQWLLEDSLLDLALGSFRT